MLFAAEAFDIFRIQNFSEMALNLSPATWQK